MVTMHKSSEIRIEGRPRVFLIGYTQRANVVHEMERLRPLIEEHADIVDCDFSGEKDLAPCQADLAIVFGGDGSILQAAHQMGERQLPVIAVNLGKLGFLADLAPDELPELLARIGKGPLNVTSHLMFSCELARGGEVLRKRTGLNEVCILSDPSCAILDIDLYVDSELVTTYSGDGLIVSTPVGSTAHNLSAGGPILRKDLQAFVISAISPHTLSVRPVVDSADRVYELVVAEPRPGTPVVVDGEVLATLEAGDRVRIVRAESQFQLVNAPGHAYYRTLREKLGWSGRLNYRTQ